MASISAFPASWRRLSRCGVLLAALCVLPGPARAQGVCDLSGQWSAPNVMPLDLSKRAKLDFNDRSWMYQVAVASLTAGGLATQLGDTLAIHARGEFGVRIVGYFTQDEACSRLSGTLWTYVGGELRKTDTAAWMRKR